jgi:hypothetical protein
MSVLNGSTFKSAKLRIAKAKPDFVERSVPTSSRVFAAFDTRQFPISSVAKENASVPPENECTPVKEINGGLVAKTSPLTEESIRKHRNGWRITATGRILYPARMRPERPLVMKHWAKEVKGRLAKSKEFRKRKKSSTVTGFRARRVTIDMVKWGSVHLKGVYMDAEGEPEAISMSSKEDDAAGDNAADLPETNEKSHSDELDIHLPTQTTKLKDLFGSHGGLAFCNCLHCTIHTNHRFVLCSRIFIA